MKDAMQQEGQAKIGLPAMGQGKSEEPVLAEAGKLPLVSVIILYYQRRDAIEQTIRSVLSQNYSNREIIVVDNHSQDDLQSVLAVFGRQVRVIDLPENVGACAGRNVGIRASRGEIIVVFDDDVGFSSPYELSKLVNTFQSRPGAHVLSLQICDQKTGKLRLREWCHPRNWKEFSQKEFETDWFGEGAAAFRRQVFDTCGLYYEPLFYGAEGGDLVIRFLNQGFRILYAPQIRVYHLASEVGRTSSRQLYFYTRNYVWLAYKDYRLFDGILVLVPKLLMMLYFAMRMRAPRPFLQGFWEGVRGLARIKPDRTPATRTALKYLAELEKGRPNLFVRLARHR